MVEIAFFDGERSKVFQLGSTTILTSEDEKIRTVQLKKKAQGPDQPRANVIFCREKRQKRQPSNRQ